MAGRRPSLTCDSYLSRANGGDCGRGSPSIQRSITGRRPGAAYRPALSEPHASIRRSTPTRSRPLPGCGSVPWRKSAEPPQPPERPQTRRHDAGGGRGARRAYPLHDRRGRTRCFSSRVYGALCHGRHSRHLILRLPAPASCPEVAASRRIRRRTRFSPRWIPKRPANRQSRMDWWSTVLIP